MRRREFITLVDSPGSKKLVKLVAVAILCLAGVHAEAAEIRDGDTGYIANNSIGLLRSRICRCGNGSARPLHRRTYRPISKLFSKSGKRGSSPDRSRSRLLAIGPTSTKST